MKETDTATERTKSPATKRHGGQSAITPGQALDIPSPQEQRQALKDFFAAVDASGDEPLTDEDYAALDNSRVSFRKDFDL